MKLDKNDTQFLLRTLYRVAMLGAFAVVLYLLWQGFLVFYEGTR